MTDQHDAGSVEEWLDNLDDVDPSAARDGQHMRRIVAARDALGAATAELHEAMTAARRAGDSWAHRAGHQSAGCRGPVRRAGRRQR